MNRLASKEIRVLAIDPTTKGFGFSVLEGPDRLIDWGVKTVRGNKRTGTVAKVRQLLELYRPDLVVLENCAVEGSRRCPRVRRLIDAVANMATANGIKARLVSRAQVHKAIAPAVTKHEIATAITSSFPELAPLLPRPRKPWMSEDYRMNIFDAIGLGLTFIEARKERSQSSRGRAPCEAPRGCKR